MSISTMGVEEDKNFRESGLKDGALLKALWPFIRPEITILGFAILLIPLTTATQIGLPYVIKQAIDGPVSHDDVNGLWLYCGIFLGLLLLNFLLRYAQMRWAQIAGGRIILNVRTKLYEHIQQLSPQFFNQTPIGKLVTRVTSDVENLSEMFSSGGIAILADIGVILGALIGMALLDVKLALYTLLVMPVLILALEYFRRGARKAYDEIRIKVAILNAFIQENITGIEVVQLFNRQDQNLSDFRQLSQDNLKVNLKSVYFDSSLSAVVEFLTNVTQVIVLAVGGLALVKGEMTIGLLIAYFQYVQMLFNPVEDLTEKYTIIQSGLASMDKIMALFQHPIAPARPLSPKTLPLNEGKSQGELQFENVTFSYQEDHPILNNISFTAKPGQTVALVGASGSGKTTTIKLLSRFYDPEHGRILLDGVDIRDLDIHDLRRQMVVIHQDDFVFSRPLIENVLLEDLSEFNTSDQKDTVAQKSLKALQEAYCMDWVNRLSQGQYELMTERGKNLSGGERQLLFFARAMAHNPPILILDEATATIDPYTESLIQAATEKMMTDRTVIIIAHRLSTIEKADQILVMEAGRIIESGTHTELLNKEGAYARFYETQKLTETKSA
jgi:ATP-binding cassette subfamily B protein